MRAVKIIGSIICLLAALYKAVDQFRAENLFPLFLSTLFIIPIFWLRPSWFKRALVIPISAFLLLLTDAYALRHRIAVEMRAAHLIWDITDIVDTFVSPSGKTTVYLLESGFLDSSFSVCLSAGGLFPIENYVVPLNADVYRRDLVVGWQGPIFRFGHRLISFAYNEDDHQIYTYYDQYFRPMDSTKRQESFDAFARSLPSKQESVQ